MTNSPLKHVPVIFLPPLVPTPSEEAEGSCSCARAGVHVRSCTWRGACALELPRQQGSHARDRSSLCFFLLLLLFLDYT